MKKFFLPILLAITTKCITVAQTSNAISLCGKEIISEIKRLMDYEVKLVLARDISAMETFNPGDFVVTNPFNQFIDKRKVLERVKSNVIKYSSYEKFPDYFHVEGENTVVVIGRESVVPTPDANRPDAGKTVNRRFTEVWVKSGNEWKRIVRHASNVVE